VTVSAGDTGSASCDGDDSTIPSVASLGLSVSGFASTPNNIAVGGTDFYVLDSLFSTYVSTSSGSSSTNYWTAKSYIPESTWNDSTTQNGAVAGDIPWTGKSANITAGSGGRSSCATGSGSTCAGYSKPSWQVGTGIHDSDGVRDIPDVSLMSGNGYTPATWLICDTKYPCASPGSIMTVMAALPLPRRPSREFWRWWRRRIRRRSCPGTPTVWARPPKHSMSYTTVHTAVVQRFQLHLPRCNGGQHLCALHQRHYELRCGLVRLSFESGYDTSSGYDLASGMAAWMQLYW